MQPPHVVSGAVLLGLLTGVLGGLGVASAAASSGASAAASAASSQPSSGSSAVSPSSSPAGSQTGSSPAASDAFVEASESASSSTSVSSSPTGEPGIWSLTVTVKSVYVLRPLTVSGSVQAPAGEAARPTMIAIQVPSHTGWHTLHRARLTWSGSQATFVDS